VEYTTEQINDLARDMCFYGDKCSKDCCALNCETTWIAKKPWQVVGASLL
jgi:hypothetical protein